MPGPEDWRTWGRTAEAMACTAAATAVRRGVPFPRWRPLLGATGPAPGVGAPFGAADRGDVSTLRGREREVAIALSSARRRLPYDPRCLDRALAGQLMLRRRGRSGTVVVGLAPGERAGGGSWGAHAWLTGLTGVLTGGAEARAFTGVTGFRPAGAPEPVPLATAATLVRWLRHALTEPAPLAPETGPGPVGSDVSGPAPTPTAPPPLPPLPPGVTAAAVVALARRHRLCSPLSAAVEALPLSAADRDALVAGRHREVALAMRSALSTVRAVTVLTDAGVRVLALKGVALAVRTTGDLTARGGGDVDLLVAPQDVPAAHAALLAAGATRVTGYVPEPGTALWPTGRLLTFEAPYRFDDGVVDLHWRPDPSPEVLDLPFEVLWRDRVTVRLAGADVATLGDEHALLLTLAHGTRDRWVRLRSVVDAVRQLRAAGPDAAAVRAAARRTGCEPALGVGLEVAARLAGGPVLPGLRAGPRARRVADDCWWDLVLDLATGGRPAVDPSSIRFQLAELAYGWRTAPGPRTRAALTRKALVCVEDMERWPLPPPMLPVYVVGRPAFALARRHARA